ncbi:MAG: RNA polymerase sigma factor [Sandaracinaceae bacterium]
MSEGAERALRDARRAHGTAEVAAKLVALYGPELLGFLAAMLRDEEAARDVFADVSEALVRDIGRFEERASYRTWAYSVARHAALNRLRQRSPRRLDTARMNALPASPRSSTRPYLKTENKERLARLRAELNPASQALLTLRIDRAMSWTEIAEVLAEAPLDDEVARRREAAKVRKRFERLKARLRASMHGGTGP